MFDPTCDAARLIHRRKRETESDAKLVEEESDARRAESESQARTEEIAKAEQSTKDIEKRLLPTFKCSRCGKRVNRVDANGMCEPCSKQYLAQIYMSPSSPHRRF